MISAVTATVATSTDKIVGPLLLGGAFNWALFGVLSTQVFVYFLTFSKDRCIVKIIVLGVYVVEALQSILIANDTFAMFVKGMGKSGSMYEVNTLWLSIQVLTGLVTFVSQPLFAYRIWILSMGRFALKGAFIVIMISCSMQITSAIVLAVASKNVGRLDLVEKAPDFWIISGISALFRGFRRLISVKYICIDMVLCSSIFGDILIAVCMIYLASNTTETLSSHTRTFLHKIVRLTVGTASATALIAIITLLLTVIGPVYPTYYEVSLWVLGKMYSNSMMVLLNNRLQISSDGIDLERWKNKTRDTERFQLSNLQFRPETTRM